MHRTEGEGNTTRAGGRGPTDSWHPPAQPADRSTAARRVARSSSHCRALDCMVDVNERDERQAGRHRRSAGAGRRRRSDATRAPTAADCCRASRAAPSVHSQRGGDVKSDTSMELTESLLFRFGLRRPLQPHPTPLADPPPSNSPIEVISLVRRSARHCTRRVHFIAVLAALPLSTLCRHGRTFLAHHRQSTQATHARALSEATPVGCLHCIA